MNHVGIFNVAVAVLIEKNGKILITKRSPNRDHGANEWEPGITGRVEQNEKIEDALHREVKEEIGIEVEIISPFRTFHFYRGKEEAEHQGVNYWCKYKSGNIVLDQKEQTEYKWVTPEESLKYLTNMDVKESVIHFTKFRKNFVL